MFGGVETRGKCRIIVNKKIVPCLQREKKERNNDTGRSNHTRTPGEKTKIIINLGSKDHQNVLRTDLGWKLTNNPLIFLSSSFAAIRIRIRLRRVVCNCVRRLLTWSSFVGMELWLLFLLWWVTTTPSCRNLAGYRFQRSLGRWKIPSVRSRPCLRRPCLTVSS